MDIISSKQVIIQTCGPPEYRSFCADSDLWRVCLFNLLTPRSRVKSMPRFDQDVELFLAGTNILEFTTVCLISQCVRGFFSSFELHHKSHLHFTSSHRPWNSTATRCWSECPIKAAILFTHALLKSILHNYRTLILSRYWVCVLSHYINDFWVCFEVHYSPTIHYKQEGQDLGKKT